MAGFDDFGSLLGKAQDVLQTLFPGALTVDGQTYAVVSSGAIRSDDAEEGGYVPEATYKVRLKKSEHPAEPVRGAVVDLDGVAVRITAVSARAWDVAWHLELEPDNAR